MISFVATPIGNLKDITLRAIEILRDADAIFCEDTRHSLKLLSAYDIKKPLYSCHKFNEREAAEKIIALSREDKKVAIISDAGMPAISDPGCAVAKALRAAGEKFTVAPGANAALSALVLSAMPSERFLFLGFPPEKKGERLKLFERYKLFDCTLILHAAPQDFDKIVEDMCSVFGDRPACAVREITKIYEEVLPFSLKGGLSGEKRGEYVLLVEGASGESELNSLSVPDHVRHYMRAGLDKKEAIKRTAADLAVPKSEIYKLVLDL